MTNSVLYYYLVFLFRPYNYSRCVSIHHILAPGSSPLLHQTSSIQPQESFPPPLYKDPPLHGHHQTAYAIDLSSRSDHICHKTTSENWEYTLRMISHSVCPGRWTCAQPPILSISGSMLTAKPHVAGDTHSNEETHPCQCPSQLPRHEDWKQLQAFSKVKTPFCQIS